MACDNYICPFFELGAKNGSLAAPELHCMIGDVAQEITFKKGDTLFLQGQSSRFLYALSDGMVKICCHTNDGREQIVGLSSPGSLLVGLQSIGEEHHAYSATAVTEVHACKISHRLLLARVHAASSLGMRLIASLNAQLAHSRALMQVMGNKCAAAKIASFILLMNREPQHSHSHFTLPFSRLEIASLLGLGEETVCRAMANMKRMGIIYAPRGNIEIRDWNRLRAIADGGAIRREVA